MKKDRLIEELEEAGIIDKNASIGAKHSKLKGLLNSISIINLKRIAGVINAIMISSLELLCCCIVNTKPEWP